jgi:hypothetical protein
MGTDLILVTTQCFDQDARFRTPAEPFPRQAFVAERAVEAFVVCVLPMVLLVSIAVSLTGHLSSFRKLPILNTYPIGEQGAFAVRGYLFPTSEAT